MSFKDFSTAHNVPTALRPQKATEAVAGTVPVKIDVGDAVPKESAPTPEASTTDS